MDIYFPRITYYIIDIYFLCIRMCSLNEEDSAGCSLAGGDCSSK